jgi:hypothetical protein
LKKNSVRRGPSPMGFFVKRIYRGEKREREKEEEEREKKRKRVGVREAEVLPRSSCFLFFQILFSEI